MALPECELVLQEMLKNANPENDPAALQKSIDSVDQKIENLEAQSAAIRECVTDKAKTDLLAYLQGDKLAWVQFNYPDVPGEWGEAYLQTYGGFGTIGFGTGNITEWEYRQEDLLIVPVPPGYRVVYSHSVNWDGDTTITDLEGDYNFGNDYLTHPVGIIASYGIEPLVDLYDNAKSMLLSNKAKIENSINVLSKYVS